jgi:hypothetical protein
MSTYKIGPLSVHGDSVYDARRPLTCERCHGVLAAVWAVAEYSGLPVAWVLRKWPEVEVQVRRHEAVCQPAAAPQQPVCVAGGAAERPAPLPTHRPDVPTETTTSDHSGRRHSGPTLPSAPAASDTEPLLTDDETHLD